MARTTWPGGLLRSDLERIERLVDNDLTYWWLWKRTAVAAYKKGLLKGVPAAPDYFDNLSGADDRINHDKRILGKIARMLEAE